MAETEIDWTFDTIPADEPAAPQPPQRPEARLRAPPRAHPRHRRRAWLLATFLLGLTLTGGLALALFYRVGWQRVRDQLAHEVAYEDAQSLARNVSAVDALHTWGTEAWRARRRAEAALGLAAPLPAENLLPLPEPPQLDSLRLLEPNLYEATVLRRYADSAGQVYTFALAQRYRNTGAGLWARQPPAEPDPAATATWAGRWITVTYPLADQAWMAAALPQIDAYLIAACADWGCPDALRLPVAFTGQVAELPRPSMVERPTGAAALPGGYPIIFDLAFRTRRDPRRVLLPSPQLAGQPRDAAATQALVRAVTANLLGQIAADLTVSNRAQYSYFLDALVARAELRLGLSTLPPPQFGLADYVPATELWREVEGNSGSHRPPHLSPRLQAAWFLEAVVGDRLASADANLITHLRSARSLPAWLEAGLQLDGQAAVARWEAEVQRQLAASAPPDWVRLAGLAYTCADGIWLVRGGRPERLPLDPIYARLAPQAISPDGRHLAVVASPAEGPRLELLDLSNLSTQVIARRSTWPLGWSVQGQLVILEGAIFNATGALASGLSVYDPATSRHTRLSDAGIAVPLDMRQSWSAGHEVLTLSLYDRQDPFAQLTGMAALTFDDLPRLQISAEPGYSPTLSPDGRWLVYIASSAEAAGAAPGAVRLKLMDLMTQASYDLLPAAALDAARITALLWSPDGVRLAVVAVKHTGQRELVTLRLAPVGPPNASAALEAIPAVSNNAFPLGFSADGRFLALSDRVATGTALMAFDLETQRLEPLLDSAAPISWSPSGHLLAVAGPGGLFVTDPATGQNQWVTGGGCTPAWYALP